MSCPIALSATQARKIQLSSQGLTNGNSKDRSTRATLKTIQQLGYIQIDSISVIQRAHHHCLWSRLPRYQIEHLDQLLDSGQIFEYWSHAAAFLPMRDFRFSLPRKQAIASGEKHWFDKDHKLVRDILQRIHQEGPLQAKDFEQRKTANSGWWDWKPAKKALEQLFMEGQLMVAGRQGFQKVYDLTERVLPADADTRLPSDEEFYRHLIIQHLQANGLAKPANISYLRKGLLKPIQQQCQIMQHDGELVLIKVKDQQYYALPQVTDLLNKKVSRSKVHILSPFDNLLIQRQRTRELFDFDYQIECYVPAQKRQYGYFCLPLLWGQQFAGRLDAKIDRKTGVLRLLHLHLETNKVEAFLDALKPALTDFMLFNQGKRIEVQRISHYQQDLNANNQQQWRQMLTNPNSG